MPKWTRQNAKGGAEKTACQEKTDPLRQMLQSVQNVLIRCGGLGAEVQERERDESEGRSYGKQRLLIGWTAA